MYNEWDYEPFNEDEYSYLLLRMEAEWMEWEYYNSLPTDVAFQRTADSGKSIPELKDLCWSNTFKKGPTYIPEPLVIEANQRPFPVPN